MKTMNEYVSWAKRERSRRDKEYRSRPTVLPLGTIISGTNIIEDVAEALEYALTKIRMSRTDRNALHDSMREMRRADKEDQAEILDDIYDLLQQYTPDFTYLGSREGDGSDIGVWPDWEAIEMEYHGEVHKGDRESCPADINYCLEVNDRGNHTFFARTRRGWKELWSTV